MSNKKPNVIYIYPDQLRYDAMSHTGNPTVKTPGLDRLSQESVNFTNAYTSFPLCGPFRSSLVTGKYAHVTGMYCNHYPLDLEKNTEFLPQVLNGGGYKTGWIGKWHLSGGNKGGFVEKEYQLGFESFVGFTRGHQYDRSIFYRNDDPTPRKSKMYEPEYQTSHLFEFIDEAMEEDRPFFAGICYGLPHPPFIEPDWYKTLYSPEEVVLADTVPEERREKMKQFMAKYYGLVTCLDNQITRVLNYLDENDLADDTVIILASDHGEMGGEHGLQHKRIHFESAMHVPFMVKYPKHYKANSKSEGMVDPSVDLFPTIVDICGLEIPDYCHGKSLVPCLENPETKVRDEVFYQLIKQPYDKFEDGASDPFRGIRTRDFLYISKNDVPSELYELANDKQEIHNLIQNPDYAEIIKEYDTKMHEIMKETGDDWDICFDHDLPEYQNQEDASVFADGVYEKAVWDVSKRSKRKIG